jgi:hypothetical protein
MTQKNLLILLKRSPPLFHSHGKTIFGIDARLLDYLTSSLTSESKTLETGLGLSTVIFASISSEHTVIVPSQDQIDRFREFCRLHSIEIEHVELICGYSQDVLPALERRDLDIILIDGGHGFPIPALDWFYTTPMLAVGGILIIDDTQLSTGDDLVAFLRHEPDWRMIRKFCRTAVFQRINTGHAEEWSRQPYVVKRSRVLRLRERLCTAAGLALANDWQQISRRLFKSR